MFEKRGKEWNTTQPLKRKKILTYTTWVKLWGHMLRGTSIPVDKDKHCMTPLA